MFYGWSIFGCHNTSFLVIFRLSQLEALQYAFSHGFETSVSVEPMLDSANIAVLVDDLTPFVTDFIWLGKMNKLDTRVVIDNKEVDSAVNKIKSGQTNQKILDIYDNFKNHTKIKWKDSIKEVVGLTKPQEIGLDI